MSQIQNFLSQKITFCQVAVLSSTTLIWQIHLLISNYIPLNFRQKLCNQGGQGTLIVE